jgi:hypothetical protein
MIPEGRVGPRPSGGVGGTRHGVKCLHAHLAWWLVDGADPVGAWVAQRLDLGPPTRHEHWGAVVERGDGRGGAGDR